MQEDFLHFLWRFKRFDQKQLQTTDGQAIEILQYGMLNTDAGPDFFNARLRIGGTEWAGNVEMHLRASDWLRHKHQEDRAYDSVILHVVFEEDVPIQRPSGEAIPCLVLNGRIPPPLQRKYQQLQHEVAWIPCAPKIGDVPEFLRLNWLDRILVERLEEKTALLQAEFMACNQHWGEAFYRSMARSFGLRQNTEAFEMLARSLPFSIVAKHSDQLLQVEALLFGQAGFLSEITKNTDPYQQQLAKEYTYLKHKYQLRTMHQSQWKFMRMRPANFPTVRLAQFANLICNRALHPDKITAIQGLKELKNLFHVSVSPYWQTHYVFGKKSILRKKQIGKTFLHLLTINTVIPFLFLYGKIRKQPDYCDQALELLEKLPPESNTIIQQWEAQGIEARNAAQSQALLHLKSRFCDKKRCLECAIGHALLR